jgi:hypothetical protein
MKNNQNAIIFAVSNPLAQKNLFSNFECINVSNNSLINIKNACLATTLWR